MDNRYAGGRRSASLRAVDAHDAAEQPRRRFVRRPDPDGDRAMAEFLRDHRAVTAFGVGAAGAGLPSGPGAVLQIGRMIRFLVRAVRGDRRR